MQIRPGHYRHYKGPLYRVLANARHSETEEWLVVYQALYGDHGIWVRPAAMFAETVLVDGQVRPRFEFLHEAAGFDVSSPAPNHLVTQS
ncbi:DUF1653 domain-containing protein [Frateuria aurantia]